VAGRPVSIIGTNYIELDASLRVGIQRTLRIPDDGGTYPLPPALGRLPVRPVPRDLGSVPERWRQGTHFLVPMHRQDAAWLQFSGRLAEPRAVKIGVGHVDALTGLEWSPTLHPSPQDYVVCPFQPWLDGFKTGPSSVRQFVAVPLGAGLTVEAQLTGQEAGGIQLASFAPKAPVTARSHHLLRRTRALRELGVGAGGRIRQRVYPDPLGFETWESISKVVIHIHLIDAVQYAGITGETVPDSPVDAATYARFGLPWFDVYDAHRGDIPATSQLTHVRSVDEITNTREVGAEPVAAGLPIRPGQIHPIPPRSKRRR
jgi:hypothetical protein